MEINLRQIMERDKPMPIDELRRAFWHKALYAKLADKTNQRDLSKRREQGLLYIDEQGLVRLGPAK